MKIEAILSTTVLPLDGVYRITTLTGAEREQTLQTIRGVSHYVGHPDTKQIAEALGAVQAPTRLFGGLQPGQTCLCLPIKQGLSTRATEGFTVHQAIQEIGTLDVRVIERLDGTDFIPDTEEDAAKADRLGRLAQTED